MRSARAVRAAWGSVLALAGTAYLAGCGSAGSGGSDAAPTQPPYIGGAAFEPTAAATTGDPFARVLEWPISTGVQASTQGELVAPGQVDVYDIGQVFTGDRVQVEVFGVGGVNPAVAVLDSEQAVLITNDDRGYYSGLTDSYAEAVVLHSSTSCFVAVSGSPRGSITGAYTLQVLLTEDQPPLVPAGQHVYLNFDGAQDVIIGSRPPVDVPPFDASSIDPDFEQSNDEIINLLVALVRDDYVGVNVIFHSSREEPPPDEIYSTVHFGTYDPELLGVAENVDEYNFWPQQEAIVFVDTFAAFSVLDPSVEEIAQALANVTSHEVGHLLGLYHTSNPRGVMDITANLRQMLGDQSFELSDLHEEVFPAGYQDAARMLVENVGGDLAAAKSSASAAKVMRLEWYDQGQGPPARDRLTFGTCPLHSGADGAH